jgi:hypothetical protein
MERCGRRDLCTREAARPGGRHAGEPIRVKKLVQTAVTRAVFSINVTKAPGITHVKKAAKRKIQAEGSGTQSVLRSVFRSFAKLAEQAGDGRPLLRGLRVAQDPTADRIVIVHGGSRVEFVLVLGAGDSPHADVECRRMDSTGATEATPIASFRFDETGTVTQSSVPELVNENIAEANGAWSIVGAVIWNAMQGPG